MRLSTLPEAPASNDKTKVCNHRQPRYSYRPVRAFTDSASGNAPAGRAAFCKSAVSRAFSSAEADCGELRRCG